LTLTITWALISTGLLGGIFTVIAVSLRGLSASQWGTFIFVASGFFTTSYIAASTNAVMPALAFVYPDWTSERSLVANVITLVGTLVGMVSFGFTADLFGRRSVYSLELLILIVATVGISSASPGFGNSMNMFAWMVFWRFCTGLSFGAEVSISGTACVDRIEQVLISCPVPPLSSHID